MRTTSALCASTTRAFSLARRARHAFKRTSRTAPRVDRARAMTARASASSFYDLSAQKLDGSTLNFADLRDKVVIVTNVASR